MALEIEITVLKYDTDYTKRSKDIKKNSWFSFPNDLIIHPDFAEIKGEEFKWFAWIVSICSKVNSNKIRLNVDHGARVINSESIHLISALKKLQGKQIDVACDQLAAIERSCGDQCAASTLHNNTIHYTTLQNTIEHYISTSEVDHGHTAATSRPAKKNNKNTLTIEERENNKKIKEAYFNAYRSRYGIEPVSNATFNTQVSNLRKKLGLDDSIMVVQFYLKHQDGFYIKNTHSFGLCLRDAETLRTQALKGKSITQNDVRNFQKIQNVATVSKAIAEGENF